jgi:ribonuclease HII
MLSTNFSKLFLKLKLMKLDVVVLLDRVTAAAVILPLVLKNTILNDSKQLSKNKKKLGSHYRETSSCFSVSHLNLIDEINILNASIKAMQECLKA